MSFWHFVHTSIVAPSVAMRATVRATALTAMLAMGMAAVASSAQAQDAKTFYRGKTVRLIVGSATGGGYDLFARLLAPYLGKALDATVVVENQPGAGGLTALNRHVHAHPDGLQIMIVNGVAAAMSQLVELDSVHYDLSKFGILGIVNAEPWVWLMSPKLPVKTPAEILREHKQIAWGGSGLVSGLADGAAMTCDALDLNCKIVLGYPGSNEVSLALGRGEVDALYVSELPALNYVNSGVGRIVAAIAPKRVRSFPNTPTIFEAVDLTADQKARFDFRIALDQLGRILVAPPNMPKDRLAYLQSAVKQVLQDPAVIAEGERRQLYVDYRDPQQTQMLISTLFDKLTPEKREQLKDVTLRKYH
ncbi:MAG TPA: tripartite tricarboxylate transporter substrate-binding protein [Xanthobacteraceae bacterium]|jgi:tripartite-type tricarboxylate transporter receptor subunit TctC|nr:tripartite tricarboxylate transporter substrate-binding protein [Xanthobacteraceae bacterium]